MNLLILHLKEEWRMMTAYFSSERLFFVFPLVLFCVGFFMGFSLPFIKKAFDMKEFITAFLLLFGGYGLFVGGFGFFAEEVAERWFGDAALLIHMHRILPLSFRKIFVWFYLKDIIYYLFLTIFPLFLGVFFSFSVPVTLFIRIVVAAVLAFLIGVSTSFLLSSLYVRARLSLVGVFTIFGILYFAGVSFDDFPPLLYLLKGEPLGVGLSVVLVASFSAASLIITNPIERTQKKVYSRSNLFSKIDPLTAKEVIDVTRSSTWQIIMTSYLFPLIFLYGIFAFSSRVVQIDLDIPLVFYGVVIGYLSTLVYSWLNNIDPPSSFTVLPITTSQVIRTKIRLFFVFSFTVAMIYLVGLGVLLEELRSLPLSFLAMGSIIFYVAALTAWLCGLNPNTRLFDGTILAQYVAAILPVLIALSVLSFMREAAALAVMALGVLLLSFGIYSRLEKRYKDVYIS